MHFFIFLIAYTHDFSVLGGSWAPINRPLPLWLPDISLHHPIFLWMEKGLRHIISFVCFLFYHYITFFPPYEDFNILHIMGSLFFTPFPASGILAPSARKRANPHKADLALPLASSRLARQSMLRYENF